MTSCDFIPLIDIRFTRFFLYKILARNGLESMTVDGLTILYLRVSEHVLSRDMVLLLGTNIAHSI